MPKSKRKVRHLEWPNMPYEIEDLALSVEI